MEYNEFIKNKEVIAKETGFKISKEELNQNLFEFQKDIVRWALIKGRAAIFADTGHGKTIMQLEWANQVYKRTKGKILIVDALEVDNKMKKEGQKYGINVNVLEK